LSDDTPRDLLLTSLLFLVPGKIWTRSSIPFEGEGSSASDVRVLEAWSCPAVLVDHLTPASAARGERLVGNLNALYKDTYRIAATPALAFCQPLCARFHAKLPN
jgi:hypothetical protein